jgi:hypothetical protein
VQRLILALPTSPPRCCGMPCSCQVTPAR